MKRIGTAILTLVSFCGVNAGQALAPVGVAVVLVATTATHAKADNPPNGCPDPNGGNQLVPCTIIPVLNYPFWDIYTWYFGVMAEWFYPCQTSFAPFFDMMMGN